MHAYGGAYLIGTGSGHGIGVQLRSLIRVTVRSSRLDDPSEKDAERNDLCSNGSTCE